MTREQSLQQYMQLMENLDLHQERGTLRPHEITQFKAQAVADLSELLAQEEGLEYDDDDNEEGYYYNQEYGTDPYDVLDQASSEFGVALLQLMAEDYGTLEEGLSALSQITGYSPEILAGIIDGSSPSPDPDLVQDIASAFNIDTDDALGLQVLASIDRVEAQGYEVEDFEDLDIYPVNVDENGKAYEEDDDEEYDEETEEGDLEEVVEDLAAEYGAVRNQLAEFQLKNDVNNALVKLMDRAEYLVNEGYMMPVEYNTMFGSLADASDQDRIAAFSSMISSNNSSVEQELYAIEKQLGVFERRGPLTMFNQYVDESLDEDELEELEQQDQFIKLQVEAMKQNGILFNDF